MKIHRLLAEASEEMLRRVFTDRAVLDRVIDQTFRDHPRWGKRDRSFVAESVYEVVRWKRALAHVADSLSPAALLTAQWRRMKLQIPDWWRHNGVSPEEMTARENTLADQPRAVRESIPDWLDAQCADELGDVWDAEIHALNQRAPVFLRANSLQTTRDEVQAWLAGEGIACEPIDGTPDALVLPPGKSLPKPLREDGRVEIQDAGSQRIAPLARVRPGDTVIDACAGAGGKTLHLASLMRNQGRIVAMDVAPRKLAELTRRADRAGASIIETHTISSRTVSDYEGLADVLLIDAPCSGLGTLRRQPDLKWRLRTQDLDALRRTQAGILADYPHMLKPGGTLVYATCSLLPSENRNQVAALASSGNFELIEELRVSPAETGFDGFYAALLRKM